MHLLFRTSYCVTKVENGRKKSRSDPFRFLLSSVCFRICGIPFPYLQKQERGFSVRFHEIWFLSRIDPYLFRFSFHFQFMWDMSKNWYIHKPTNHKLSMLTYGILVNIGPIISYLYIILWLCSCILKNIWSCYSNLFFRLSVRICLFPYFCISPYVFNFFFFPNPVLFLLKI